MSANHSEHNLARAEELSEQHKKEVFEHLQELEEKTRKAEELRQKHFNEVSQAAHLSDHSETVLEHAKQLAEINEKIDSRHEKTSMALINEQFAFDPSEAQGIHSEIVQIRKELHDFNQQQHEILDLIKDELKQVKAAEKREEAVRAKIPATLEDRIEHVKQTHERIEIEKMLEAEEKHKAHENKMAAIEQRRQDVLNKRIEKAKYLETHQK